MSASIQSTDATLPTERRNFLSLLLANPNHFGSIADSKLKPVQIIKSNTTYEELKCIGFSPELSRLEGVVWIKQPTGYDGGLCTSGSQEYVSFYLSYDNGATWLAQGTVNFTVYDVTGPHPLEYAVSLPIQTDKKLCYEANLPLVRAILSWGTPPSGPNAHPVWGNIIETRIQIPGFLLDVSLPILLSAAQVTLPPALAAIVAPDATIKLQAPQALSATALSGQYANTAVPPHRFLQPQIQSALKNPASLAASSAYLSNLGVDVSAVLTALAATSGNTDYEQLECIGLEEGDGNPDALAATLVIKLPTGYLGSPCFAVLLPVNLNAHRKTCEEGPVTAQVRAILSWNSPPPPSNPDFVPVWGNRLDTNILVNPGAGVQIGDFTPYITSICAAAPCDINPLSGWANPGTGDNPFGASIAIYGYIPGAPLFVDPPVGLPVYQVTVQQIDTTTNTLISGTQQTLTDPFPINILKQVGGGFPTSTSQNQTATGGYFTYQPMTPNPGVGWNSVTLGELGGGANPLAVWNSVVEGTYLISVTAWDATKTTSYLAGKVLCTDGTTRQNVVIDLDQTPPNAEFVITGYKAGGVGPILPATDCATFTVGDIICGTYSVSDLHLGGFSFEAEPTPSPTSGFTVFDGATQLSGNGESYPAGSTPTGTVTGTWQYNTAGLPPCGYTIQLFSNDRTIVDCNGSWENNSQFQGFCLVASA